MEIPGIGEKKALELIDQGITTIKKLEKAVQEKEVKLTTIAIDWIKTLL